MCTEFGGNTAFIAFDDADLDQALIILHAVDSVRKKAIEAVEDGAKVIVNGNDMNRRGILLTKVNYNSRIWQKVTFRLVPACVSFKTETEAINLTNDTTSGLGKYQESQNINIILFLLKIIFP